MDVKSITLNSGIVKYTIYNSEDVNKKGFIKPLIRNLYTNLTEFTSDIIWILRVIPNSNKSYSEVIKEFVETIKHDNALIMSQAGILTMIGAGSDEDIMLTAIAKDREELYNSGFTNILFNRVMSQVYGNPEFFIYVDEFSSKFISDNIGTDKIIARISNNI